MTVGLGGPGLGVGPDRIDLGLAWQGRVRGRAGPGRVGRDGARRGHGTSVTMGSWGKRDGAERDNKPSVTGPSVTMGPGVTMGQA